MRNQRTSCVLSGSQFFVSQIETRARKAGETQCWPSAGDEVVGDAEERVDGDGGTDLFQGFADGALFEGFEIVEFAADDAPAAGFGRAAAER
jgi:hypothetical protein